MEDPLEGCGPIQGIVQQIARHGVRQEEGRHGRGRELGLQQRLVVAERRVGEQHVHDRADEARAHGPLGHVETAERALAADRRHRVRDEFAACRRHRAVEEGRVPLPRVRLDARVHHRDEQLRAQQRGGGLACDAHGHEVGQRGHQPKGRQVVDGVPHREEHVHHVVVREPRHGLVAQQVHHGATAEGADERHPEGLEPVVAVLALEQQVHRDAVAEERPVERHRCERVGRRAQLRRGARKRGAQRARVRVEVDVEGGGGIGGLGRGGARRLGGLRGRV
mmetsp:Transcript_7442/g.30253  ORF Transcript_7442/g.30253 Transcript_7442/m.30253 type:complete len:279 (-) Transcript_7442:106-942(-)